jgi:hypothetical protein
VKKKKKEKGDKSSIEVEIYFHIPHILPSELGHNSGRWRNFSFIVVGKNSFEKKEERA